MHPLLIATIFRHAPHTYADQSNTPLLFIGLFFLMLIIPCLMGFETARSDE